MKEFTPEDLLEWAQTPLRLQDPLFVIVSTQSCPKCALFINNIDKYITLFDNQNPFVKYVHKNGPTTIEIAKILTQLDVSSIPVLLYKTGNEYESKLGVFNWNEEYEIDNWLSAIRAGNYEFFGINKYGELQEGTNAKDVDKSSIDLIDTLHGIDEQILEERAQLRQMFAPDIPTI
jgi:hypothetical protein